MEVLVDDKDEMCGFVIHWPNNSESVYKRTKEGIEMSNCSLDIKNGNVELFVGLFAQNRGEFSPLVERNGVPVYTKLRESDTTPVWPVDFMS